MRSDRVSSNRPVGGALYLILSSTCMPRLALLAVVSVVALVLIVRVVVPGATGTKEATTAPGAPERSAAQVLSGALAAELPAERRVNCRRAGQAQHFDCGWRAARRLSPNRTRRCRGRGRVTTSGGERAAQITRRQCAIEVKALDPRFGFHDNSVAAGRASPDEVARLAEGTGAGIYRFLLDWRAAEPQRDRYDFRMPDRVYRAMTRRGIRPLLLISWAPSWSWDRSVVCAGPDCRFPPGRQNDGQWRQFAALVAKRYPMAAGIEIWNEPNEVTSWMWQPDPERYLELLKGAYGAIKAANPSMTVISGGLTNRDASGNDGLSLSDFAKRLFAGGGADYMDGIAVHPYVPADALERLNASLDQLRSLRPRELPLWVTEVGLTTSAGPLVASEQEQAAGDVQAYRTFHGQRDVKAVLIHTLIDPYDDPAKPNSGFGVVRGDLTEKPAYCALARATGARAACP